MGRTKDLFMEMEIERMMEEEMHYNNYVPTDEDDRDYVPSKRPAPGNCDGECWDCSAEDCGNSMFDRD